MAEAWCCSCKSKVEMVNPTKFVTKNGRNAIRGTCKSCKGKVVQFVKKG